MLSKEIAYSCGKDLQIRLISFTKCFEVNVGLPRSFLLMNDYTFLIGFASGDCESQSKVSMSFFSFQDVQSRLRCLGLSSLLFSWSIQSSPLLINQHCADGIKAFWYIFNIFSAFRTRCVRNTYFENCLF